MSGSLRARLSRALVPVVVGLLLTVALALTLVVERSIRGDFDAELLARARTYAALVEYDVEDGLEFELGDALARLPGDDGDAAHLSIWGPDGAALLDDPALTGLSRQVSEGTFTTPVIFDHALPDGAPSRVVGLRFRARADPGVAAPDGVTLAIARSTARPDAVMRTLYGWFVGLGLASIVAATAAVRGAVRRGLAPVDGLARALERATGFAPLPSASLPDELRPLVTRFNALLGDLERAFARERRFTADVAHELRTPLSVLQSTIELTLTRERAPAEYRDALARLHKSVLSTAALVEDLLLLARLDAGQVPVAREPVPLRALVDDCQRPHAEAAARRRLRFENLVPATLELRSDRDKLRIVVGNLLANAVAYTEEGGWIRVRAGEDVALEVRDSGPPLAAEARARIFDRFWRADEARSADEGHCGIGLSLARSLCEALGLSLALASDGDEVAFQLRPRAREDMSQ